jgi:hypothetical protein
MDRLTDELLAAISDLPVVSTGRLPQLVEDAWPDIVLICVRNWARGVGRDLRRAESSLAAARPTAGAATDDDQIASLEECFWRVASAVEKFDALVAVAFGGGPLRPQAQQPTRLEMRPNPDRNKQRLREVDTDAARELIERRSKLGGTRATLRRNQVMHSLAPLASVDDLAPFIRVIHRDGRILVNGYSVVRWVPERWNEGIHTLDSAELFARRLLEAERALDDLRAAVRALIDTLKSDAALREPQWIWIEQTTAVCTLERPKSMGPPARYEVEFVFRPRNGEDTRRSIDCESVPLPGTEIAFEDGVWRVIETHRVEDERLDARVVLIPKR